MEQEEPREGGGQNPEIQAKVEFCMQEAEQAQQECLAMSCPEALACLEGISQYAPGGQQGEPTGGGGQNAEIQAKIQSCVQEMMPPGGMTQSEGFEGEEGTEGPSPEEIERMIQGETQRRIQEETQRMIEQFAPSPSTEAPPQSFLDRVGNFLAGLIPAI